MTANPLSLGMLPHPYRQEGLNIMGARRGPTAEIEASISRAVV